MLARPKTAVVNLL
jgi:hypothetical protein